MIAAFDIGAMYCACGNPVVMCVDPGADAEMDPVFDIVLKRAVAPRGWCLECFTRFAALIPHEAQKKPRRPAHG